MHFPSLGPKEGRYDRAFVRWCRRHGHLCIRTVELFWWVSGWRRYPPQTLSRIKLRKEWETARWDRKRLARARKDGPCFVAPADPAHGIGGLILMSVHTKKQLAEYIAHQRPLGTWMQYWRACSAYYRKERARYKKVCGFWRSCGSKMRRDFRRCVRYSNRIPEAHPDYLVRFRTKFSNVPAYGFVEVKGPRESLRPSQKRFFPELVRKAGQHIWVARVESASRIRFARFNPKGELQSCSLL